MALWLFVTGRFSTFFWNALLSCRRQKRSHSLASGCISWLSEWMKVLREEKVMLQLKSFICNDLLTLNTAFSLHNVGLVFNIKVMSLVAWPNLYAHFQVASNIYFFLIILNFLSALIYGSFLWMTLNQAIWSAVRVIHVNMNLVLVRVFTGEHLRLLN